MKRLLFILTAIFVICASVVPSFALGPTVTQNDDFIIEQQSFIGWNDCSVILSGDGSFEYTENGAAVYVSFGEGAAMAEVSKNELPYPVTTHTYTLNDVSYTVEQFAYGDDSGAVCVYSRFTVKNSSESSVPFPTVMGTVPVSTVPSSVEKGKSASCDYIVSVRASAAEGAGDVLKSETFDSAKEKMKEHWNSYLSELLTISSLSKSHKIAVTDYHTAVIDYAVTGTASPCAVLASPALAAEILASSSDAYTCALAIMKTGTPTALATLDSIRNIANDIIYNEDEGALPSATLDGNLDVLLTVQSYAFLLKKLSVADPSLAEDALEAKEFSKTLADSIATALKETEKELECDWEVATTGADAPLILNGEDMASAKALCSWYTKSAVFTDAPSTELIALAKDANTYYTAANDPAAAILSLALEREDGTLIIGRGAPLSLLSSNESVTVNNFVLSSGNTISVTVKASKKNIDVTLSGALSTPFQIEFPVLCDNLEYSSAGFDSASGVVTAPEGTSSVSIRLNETVSDSEAYRKASVKLETALCAAYEKKVETPTTISKEEFDSALKRAQKARTATADEKNTTADALILATEALSPMVAGYNYTAPENGVPVGTLTKSEIYQKFSLPANGTVTTLFVKGEYSDGISAAVYTLRGDNYTTDELRAESYGEKAEGGITFELNFEAEAEKIYVLCIFSEDKDVTLALESSDADTCHTVEAGETIVYTRASLAYDFTVRQADRKDLDTFYSACLEANVSEYTKESQKTLKNKMKAAKALLCTSSVTQDEYEKVYDDLKKAFDGLDTYASEDKIEETPIVGLVLIGIVIILLAGTFVTALAARKKMNPDS